VIAALVFGDLGIANRHINPTVDSRAMTGIVTPIDSPPRLGEGRVMVNAAAQALLDATILPTPQQAVLIPRQSLILNANLLEQIPKLDGFFSLYLPQSTAVVSNLPEDTNAQRASLLEFLGVAYQSQPDRPWQWNKRSQWMALATLVPSAVFVETTNAFSRLFSDQFHPREQVILSPDVKDQVKANGQGHGQILSSRVTAHRLSIITETDQPMFLVLAQADYPGWRASIDNGPVPLWKANYAFQALEIPGGRHEVQVYFRSRSFEIGAAISAATIIICGFLFRGTMAKVRPLADH
jgi:Bacterial membrane protein YfhO